MLALCNKKNFFLCSFSKRTRRFIQFAVINLQQCATKTNYEPSRKQYCRSTLVALVAALLT